MHPTSNVRYVEIEGAAVVLDLRTESYTVLDPIATEMWRHLVRTEDRKAVVLALHEKYGVEESRLEADLEAFAKQCVEKGFLQKDPPAPPPELPQVAKMGRKSFLTLRAWWSLLRTARTLRKSGFAKVYERYRSIPIPECDDLKERLHDALAAFASAENFFHMKKAPEDCLPRSLSLFRFLRAVGLPAHHCIGVRRYPFGAHAWVEIDGGVVHDHPEQLKVYTRIAVT